MRKRISFMIACVLLVSMLSVPANAAEVDTDQPPVVTERYAYLSNCWAGLTHTGGGWYDVSGGAGSAVNGVTLSVTVILQKFNPQSITSWDDLYTMTDTNQYSASAGTSRYIASSGTYRTHVIVNVYIDGILKETETVNSDFVRIP